MRKRTILTTVAVLAVGAIVVPTAANAANGGSWLLGRSNYESSTTTVTNNYGTTLSLNSKAGYAPLKVNRNVKVTNLNADLVDGVSSGSLARSTAKSGVVYHDGYTDGMGAKCPTGTIVAGGGGYDPLGWTTWYSGPDFTSTGALIPNSWLVMDEMGYPLVSFANCVNVMGGAISGALTNVSQFPGASSAAAAQSDSLSPQEEGPGVPAAILDMRNKAKDNPKPAKQ